MSSGPSEQFGWRLQGAIYGAAFFTGNLFPMISVVMPLWALELGASPFVIGLIVSSRQILTVTLSIHGGALMDRYGVRQVILVLGTAGAVTMGLFPALPFIWAVILLQMVSGFAETTGWIGTQALVGSHLKGHAVFAGRMTASARTGGFFGPWLTGLAWHHFGPVAAFLFLGGWVFCGVIAVSFVPRGGNGSAAAAAAPAKKSAAGRAGEVMPKLADYATALRLLLLPAIALVILSTFMRQAGSGIQSSFYGVWLKSHGFDAATIGLLIGLGNLFSAAAALTVGPLVRRIADHWLLIAMITVAIVTMAVTPLLDTITLLVVAMALRGIAQGINLPVMMSIAARTVGPELQGRVAALRITFNRLGGALVPIIMGALAEWVGLERSFYWVGITGCALVLFLAVWVARSPAFRNG